MELTKIVGVIAGVLTAISLFPQLLKIIREKKAEDISVMMLLVLLTGFTLWIVYGLMKKDAIIVATNCTSLIINIFIIFFRWKYNR